MYASQRDRNREREGESQRERKPGREREIERATDNRQQRFSLAVSDSLWLLLLHTNPLLGSHGPCSARSFSPALQHFILVCVEPHNLLPQYFKIVAQGTFGVFRLGRYFTRLSPDPIIVLIWPVAALAVTCPPPIVRLQPPNQYKLLTHFCRMFTHIGGMSATGWLAVETFLAKIPKEGSIWSDFTFLAALMNMHKAG